MSKAKICHITTVHSVFDDRIFFKECMTLARQDYEVILIAQHDKNEILHGIKIVALPKVKRRFSRILGLTLTALGIAIKQRADVYHFHDPELLPVGILLKVLTLKKVIYDVHEDYKQKFLSKPWINKELRKPISRLFGFWEKISCMFFDYIITADTHIKMQFNRSKSEVIANYPPLNFLDNVSRFEGSNSLKIIYAGTIAEDRGSSVMIEAMKNLVHMDIELHIIGEIQSGDLINEVKSLSNVKYHGVVPWKQVSGYLVNADIGFLLLQPLPTYINLSGEGVIKLYEYMMFGLAIIASDFPGLRKVISGIGSGICVDPTDILKITESIEYLYQNPDLRKQMGEKGRRAVIDQYNWDTESRKLKEIYKMVLT
jgi:glycosyltransferase involved in cell wall biosynthesis